MWTFSRQGGGGVVRLLRPPLATGLLEGYSPIGRLSLGIPRRISSNCQNKQVQLVMRTTLVF